MCSPLVSRLIGQPLALGADQQRVGALSVVQPGLDPLSINLLFGLTVVVAEIKLSAIPLKMLRADVVKGADDAALQDRKESFHGVGGHVAAHILPASVVDVFMALKHARHLLILPFTISDKSSLGGVQLRLENGPKVLVADGRQMEGASLTGLALDQRKHHLLAHAAAGFAIALAGVLVLFLAAYVSLIRLNGRAALAEDHAAILHGLTDAMGQEPRALDGDAKGPLQLVRADAFFAAADEEDRLQPQAQGNVAGLEYGADLDGKGLPAVLALPQTRAGGLALQLIVALVHAAAVRAYRAMRPDAFLNELIGGFFVVEVGAGKDGFAHGWLRSVVPV